MRIRNLSTGNPLHVVVDGTRHTLQAKRVSEVEKKVGDAFLQRYPGRVLLEADDPPATKKGKAAPVSAASESTPS